MGEEAKSIKTAKNPREKLSSQEGKNRVEYMEIQKRERMNKTSNLAGQAVHQNSGHIPNLLSDMNPSMERRVQEEEAS